MGSLAFVARKAFGIYLGTAVVALTYPLFFGQFPFKENGFSFVYSYDAIWAFSFLLLLWKYRTCWLGVYAKAIYTVLVSLIWGAMR